MTYLFWLLNGYNDEQTSRFVMGLFEHCLTEKERSDIRAEYEQTINRSKGGGAEVSVIVVYRDGSWKTVLAIHAWEYEADPDWLVTIPLKEWQRARERGQW
jgi:hypothetical protein